MVPGHELDEEQANMLMQSIATFSSFWVEWDKLKTVLSVKLKQVLSDYPEAKMSPEVQITALGETFQDLVKRLDEALLSFDEGPPFTLQRICEILLSAQSIYPKLSKLAFALEKNLLVTSFATQSPKERRAEEDSEDPVKASEKGELQSGLQQDGDDIVMGDREETIAAMEEADIEEGITIDMETFGDIVGPSETSPPPTSDS